MYYALRVSVISFISSDSRKVRKHINFKVFGSKKKTKFRKERFTYARGRLTIRFSNNYIIYLNIVEI